MKPLAAVAIAALTLGVPAGCGREEPHPVGTDAGHAAETSAATNRVAIPASVRQNLGVTFAKVERRAVERTIRVPGRFELLPHARREYHAPLDGRVELLVSQYQPVEPGAPLYRLDSPAWRELQGQIADAEAAVARTRAEDESTGPLLEAHAAHRDSLEATVGLWGARVEQLEQIREAGGGKANEWASAQASLAEARAALADVLEQSAGLEARRIQARAELQGAVARRDLLLARASTLLGIPADQLGAPHSSGVPLWRTVAEVEVRAATPGVVESIAASSGAWVEERGAVLSTAQPRLVRFRARGLQSDLGRLRDGLPARVVPPQGGSLGPGPVMEGTLALGLTADADERTVDLIVTPREAADWARAGVAGFLEVVTEGAGEQLAIPLAAVIRDGLTSVIFRRDPADPDRAIRLEADLGIDDGRWVVIRSGVKEDDEVVLEGVYQLMLATSGSASRGGHFHADGTFHEGDDDKEGKK